ncbi:hypothetical protein M3Y99_00324900 [Aphelenchoides fujianensis]|nr:hypothetical protein M3Y99_00324900 [Aphelenchoides fujianensis]
MNGSMKDGDDTKEADALVPMPKLPFFPSRSCRTGPPSFDQLDFSYNAELDVSLQLRKLEYSQLFNQYARMSTKIRALATLLKYELEEEHSHYLLRNNDVVIQICIDHDGALTNCFTSWYGGQLRVNEKLKLLLSQNRWVTILRLLRVMNQTIPNCVPMHERVNCLNGLIVLEQDLTVLFTENKLALQIYGKEDVEVFRPRTDLTPFTVALHWEMYKRRFSVAIKDVMSKESPLKHPLVAYLSVVYHEYMTLFPSASCLINNYNWAHLSDGIYTPGNYCLHFSRPVIVRRSMIQELIEDNGVTVYTLRPINWFRETSNGHNAKNAVVFGHSNKKQAGACHQYLFGEQIDQSADDFLIRRITFTAPKTVVGLITKLRRQASFIGLIRNLFEQASARRRLPYTDRLMVTIETPKATSLVLYFNHNNQVFGMINLEVLGHRFDIRINLGYGRWWRERRKVAWEKLLMETWSIPKLMHRVVLDLTAANLLNVPNLLALRSERPSSAFLRDAFSIKAKLPTSRSQFDFSHAFELDDSKQAHNRTSTQTSPATAAASKRQAAFLRISPKRSWLLNDFHLRRQRTLRIKKAAAFRKLDVPPARRQALTKCLFTTRTLNQKDETRIPPLHIEARTPTILPLATSRLRTQLRALRLNRRHKLQAKKRAATIAQPENSKGGRRREGVVDGADRRSDACRSTGEEAADPAQLLVDSSLGNKVGH